MSTPSTPTKSPSKKHHKRPNVFERLSNPMNFTGVYLERFRSGGSINAEAPSGNINSLAEILRPTVKSSTCVHISFGWDPGQHKNSGLVHDTPATRNNPYHTTTGNSALSIPFKAKIMEESSMKKRRKSLSALNSPHLQSPFFNSELPSAMRTPSVSSINRPSSALPSFRNDSEDLILSKLRLTSNLFDEKTSPNEKQEDGMSAPVSPTLQLSPSEKSANLRERPSITVLKHHPTEQTKLSPITIYDRLYDSSTYTGVYKERFASGNGCINGSSEYYPENAMQSACPEKRIQRTPAKNSSLKISSIHAAEPQTTTSLPNQSLASSNLLNSPDRQRYFRQGSYSETFAKKAKQKNII
ncbi:hypothetical protein C9374_009690 [Naegleria lovaniensis]|uniref:Uncharacterized protein n=1 Tax=Naegleria lovaniensis TaxID=51637 RepID=A0AA88KPG9_NAELO|nr:uncharacterized protein C9374_009690 [Naegleria lovaniensis]KAG2393113.1 hypothetical protein C9374_009690 [Naegleria lovaniensis]